MVLHQSRAMRIKSHAGWAAALSSRSRNRKYCVWILLLNQETTHYNECHPLAIRLASPSSGGQEWVLGCSLQHNCQGAGEAPQTHKESPFQLAPSTPDC